MVSILNYQIEGAVPKVRAGAKSSMKRVALKYCGGCNPSYDRVEYALKIQDAAGDGIEWIRLDDGGCAGVLLINGCDRACGEIEEYAVQGLQVVSIRNRKQLPEEIIAILLQRGNDSD